ncbi:MAG: Wzz/FepE/Etk N-terminal domain-containing protein, partial [Pseudomonadota bacterium]
MTAAPDPRAFEAAMAAGPPAPVAAAELLSVLWRRKGLVLLGGLLGLSLAAAALARLPDRWTAQAEVLLEARAPMVVDLAQVLPAAPYDAQAVQSEMRLILSQQLLARVARKLRLAEDPAFGGSAEGGRLARLTDRAKAFAASLAERHLGWTPPAPRPAPPDLAERRAVRELRRSLDVKQQDLSRVIAVRVTSGDPAMSALLANAVADQYIVDQLEAKFDATERAARWLEERLTDISGRLEAAEAAAEAQRARLAAA